MVKSRKSIKPVNLTRDNKNILPILSIVIGILIIALPQILAYAIGIYLIITGILKLIGK